MHDDLLGDVEMFCEGGQFYIVVNGNKIAKREGRQWTSLVPGYSFEDLDGGERIAIDVDCSKLPLGHREAIEQRAGIERPVLRSPFDGPPSGVRDPDADDFGCLAACPHGLAPRCCEPGADQAGDHVAIETMGEH
jgi:hypothetical protein